MLIHNETKTTMVSQADKSQPLKEGATYQATVKEKLPNNEAIVQMKGQEVRVKVEGNIPDTEKVTLQVTDMKQEVPVVKAVPVQTNMAASGQQHLPLSDHMKQAVNIINQQKMPINRETLEQVKGYLDKGTGTLEQKLETIAYMAKKKLDFTPQQLRAVHEALHGSSLGEVLQDLATELDSDFDFGKLQNQSNNRLSSLLNKLAQVVQDPAKLAAIQQLIRMAQQGGAVNSIIKTVISKYTDELKINPSLAKELSAILQASNQSNVQSTGGQSLSVIEETPAQSSLQTAIQAALKQIKTAPDVATVLKFIQENEAFQALPHTEKNRLEQALTKAKDFHTSGRELAARHELAAAMTKIEGSQPQQNQAAQEADTAYRLSNDIVASIPVQSRDLIVTAITKKLSQAALDFKAVKRDITNALQTSGKLMKQAPVLAKPPLEAAIKQLDQAILKSNFMLYTDMDTEKKLLVASSQLHEARKWLAKGESAKASEIVNQVRNTVDKLIFQPSDVRMKHFVSKEMLQLEQLPTNKQLTQALEEPLLTMKQQPTARSAFEYVRNLGLTYDTDAAHRLASGEASRAEADASLKNVLLKLAQNEGNSKAEQALQHITGQQLLSKTDHTGLQSMMFSLPILLKDELNNVKVFLNSKNSSERIDWENCSLYFLLETKRMGDVGVLLNAVDRTLSLTLKNDRVDFQAKVAPLADTVKGRLEDIGYQMGTIQFTKLSPESKSETPPKQQEKEMRPRLTESGYDFSV